jgi:hypothetical protein
MFPPDRTACLGLFNPAIAQLSTWYDDDFGIVPGDTNVQRRGKLLDWIRGY